MTTPALHILLANSVRLFAGAERFLLDAATGLRERGHRVTVQAYPNAPLANLARERHLDVHTVATRADGAPWQVWPLRRWLDRAAVDVVLTNYEKDLRTVGWAARLGHRPIAIVHSRECDAPLKDLPHYRYFYRSVAHHVLANSEATLRTLLRSAPWLPQEKVSVLYKGVDVEAFAQADPTPWRSRLGAQADEVVFGFAGQLVGRKRCDVLLRALSGLPPHVRWRLGVAGEGPDRDALEKMAAAPGIADRVVFCGFVKDIAAWMQGIDVLVLPSLVEGFGYVLVEAAACGKPVLAFAASSAPELVEPGRTGLLVDPAQPEGLTAGLTELATHAALRQRLGAAAQARARRDFSMALMLDRLEHRLLHETSLATKDAPFAARKAAS